MPSAYKKKSCACARKFDDPCAWKDDMRVRITKHNCACPKKKKNCSCAYQVDLRLCRLNLHAHAHTKSTAPEHTKLTCAYTNQIDLRLHIPKNSGNAHKKSCLLRIRFYIYMSLYSIELRFFMSHILFTIDALGLIEVFVVLFCSSV